MSSKPPATKTMDLKKLVREVLEKGYLMSLGICDSGGVWVSDVIYVHNDNFEIFWISQISRRHSKAIEKNPEVAATITVSNGKGEPNMGIQVAGRAEKLDSDVLDLGIKHRQKRGKKPPKNAGEILDSDESWYKLSPDTIELIYEPLFGFGKKKVKL